MSKFEKEMKYIKIGTKVKGVGWINPHDIYHEATVGYPVLKKDSNGTIKLVIPLQHGMDIVGVDYDTHEILE